MNERSTGRVKRRPVVAAFGGMGSALLAGCLGNSVSHQSTLDFDRPSDSGTECHAVELVDRDYRLGPRISPLEDAGLAWPIELDAGDALHITVYWWGERNRVLSLPDLTLFDPTETPIYEESRYSSNHHVVEIVDSGIHTLQMQNRHFSEGGRWKFEITWYSSPECA